MLISNSLKALALTGLIFSQGILAQESFLSESTLLKEIAQNKALAINNKHSHLPDFIEDKLIICSIKYAQERQDCLVELLSFSQEILTCRDNQIKKDEMAKYDRGLFRMMLEDNGEASIPSEIKNVTGKLIDAAKTLYPHTQSLPWKLNAYNSKVLNAHAGADTQIMLSAGLWDKESPMTTNEVSAIIAHEVSHIIKDHSLLLGCNALEWVGQHFELKLAMDIFREDFSVHTRRGEVWSEMSQRFEYEADQYATELLNEIGLSPFLMGKALNKLRPKNGAGFSSGSHPELDDRINAADSWAKRFE